MFMKCVDQIHLYKICTWYKIWEHRVHGNRNLQQLRSKNLTLCIGKGKLCASDTLVITHTHKHDAKRRPRPRRWWWLILSRDDVDDDDDEDDYNGDGGGLYIGRIFWLNWTGWKKMKWNHNNATMEWNSVCVCVRVVCVMNVKLVPMPYASVYAHVYLWMCYNVYVSLFKQHLLKIYICDWHPLVKYITDTVRQVSNFFSLRIFVLYTRIFPHSINTNTHTQKHTLLLTLLLERKWYTPNT